MLELARIPNTTDVLGTYVVQLDEDGHPARLHAHAPLPARSAAGGLTDVDARPHPGPRGPAAAARGGPTEANLADILERVLDKGIVIAGDIQINLLDIELLTIKLRLLIASVDRAREMGINWWESDPSLQKLGPAATSGAELEHENRELRERLERLERQLGVGRREERDGAGG